MLYAFASMPSTLKSVSSSPKGSDMRTAIDCRPIMIPVQGCEKEREGIFESSSSRTIQAEPSKRSAATGVAVES